MTVFDTKKHTNIKRHAKYRCIGKYTKSLPQYKKEKQRRKQALELQDQGVPNKEIAEKLAISTRTVQRILEKPKPYIQRQKKYLARCESGKVLEQLNGKTAQNSGVRCTLEHKKTARTHTRTRRLLLDPNQSPPMPRLDPNNRCRSRHKRQKRS
jgi:FixJ family two-component response regulator